jgi:hypothetical protein
MAHFRNRTEIEKIIYIYIYTHTHTHMYVCAHTAPHHYAQTTSRKLA